VFQRRPGDDELLDRLGRRTAGVPDGPFVWSADSRGICILGSDPTQHVLPGGGVVYLDKQLSTEDTQGHAVQVATINYLPASQSLHLPACSFASDVAVITWLDTTKGAASWTGYEMYSLTSRTLPHGLAQNPPFASIVASQDGEYVALTSVAADSSADTQIRSATGSQTKVANLHVAAFNGDDTLVLTDSDGQLMVEDWRTGRVVWSHPDLGGSFKQIIEPEGASFAIAFPTGMSIVRSDGSVVNVPGSSGITPVWTQTFQ
jgi:hypothetical protein